jgi:hypothetical protein
VIYLGEVGLGSPP